MAVPSSGQLSLNSIYNELDDDDYSGGTTNSDVSLTNLCTSGDPPDEDINTDNASGDRPDGSAPHQMSEFYSYDHDASAGGTSWTTEIAGFILSGGNDAEVVSDPKTVVVANGSGNTTFEVALYVGGNPEAYLAVSDVKDPGASGGDSGWIASTTTNAGNVVTIDISGGGTYYLRFKLTMPERVGTAVSTFTATNNSVATTTSLTAQSTG
tara:strand:- start:56 stop:685 length:630 start_codon:yes stop_codon:yes gene_type:complete